MTDHAYCYSCRLHHPRAQMRPYPTKSGTRLRCIRSIEAANLDRASREDFGRQQTAINRDLARRMVQHLGTRAWHDG